MRARGAPPLPFSVSNSTHVANMVYQVPATAAHVSRLFTTQKVIKNHVLPGKSRKNGVQLHFWVGLDPLGVIGHGSYT